MRYLLSVVLLLALAGCGTPQQMLKAGLNQPEVKHLAVPSQSVVLTMPVGYTAGQEQWELRDITSPTLYKGWPVKTTSTEDHKAMTFTMKHCVVAKYPSGGVFPSCVILDGTISDTVHKDYETVVLTPTALTTSQSMGELPVFNPTPLPPNPSKNWHKWLMSQYVGPVKYTIKSKLSPKYVKAALDQRLHHGAITPSLWMLNPVLAPSNNFFAGVYGFKINGHMEIRARVSVYPQTSGGSDVVFTLQGRGTFADTYQRNWAGAYSQVVEEMRRVAKAQ